MPRMKNIKLALFLVLAAAGTASAGGVPGSIGVGAEFELSDVGGLSVNYDAGKFHVGGALGLKDPGGPDNDIFNIAGRFFYHVATTASADFGIGGGLGIQSVAGTGAQGRATGLFLEPGFQIRAFIVPNVALSFTGGISIGTIDADGTLISGDFNGNAGIHYYF
jgi:hypothetical protein